MPAPTNTTPGTAIEIPSLPFTHSQNLTGVGTGTGYASTCRPGQEAATWYRYTTGPTQYGIRISCDYLDDPLGFGCYVSVWVGTPPSLTQFQYDAISSPQLFCHD